MRSHEIHKNPMRIRIHGTGGTYMDHHSSGKNQTFIDSFGYNTINIPYMDCTCRIVPGLVPVVNHHADRKSPDPFQMAFLWLINGGVTKHQFSRDMSDMLVSWGYLNTSPKKKKRGKNCLRDDPKWIWNPYFWCPGYLQRISRIIETRVISFLPNNLTNLALLDFIKVPSHCLLTCSIVDLEVVKLHPRFKKKMSTQVSVGVGMRLFVQDSIREK